MPAPTLSSLSPTSGTTGTALTLTGTNFGTAGSTVKVNFINATETVIVSGTVGVGSTTVTTTVPLLNAFSQCSISVTVGTSTSNTRPFFYVRPPVGTSLAPAIGPITPGTSSTLTGTGFAGMTDPTKVQFTLGAVTVSPAAITVTGDTQIAFTPPADPSAPFVDDVEAWNVTVTTAGGTTAPLQFTFYNLPTATSVSPNTGPISTSGFAVYGTSFIDVSAVTFTDRVGGSTHAATDVTFTDTQATFTTPATLVRGHLYDVTVTTPGGTSAIVGDTTLFTAA